MENHPLRSGASYSFMYFAGFVIVLVFASLLLQIGSTVRMVSLLMLAFVGISYLLAGFTGRTMSLDSFQFADRKPSTVFVAQAVASGTIASGIFIVLAGLFYETGISAFAYFWGWLLGLALMTLLFAAGVSRSGKSTLPAALVRTGDNPLLRIAVLVMVIVCCVFLLFVQLEFIARVGEQLLNIGHAGSITAAAFAIGTCVLLSGMQGVTLIRAIAYPVLFVSMLAPLIWIATKVSGIPLPQLAFGTGALQPIAEIDQELVEVGLTIPDSVFDLAKSGTDNLTFTSIPTVLCIAFATAASPHLLSHFTTISTGREARRSSFLAVGLVLLFLTAIPAVAAFVRFEIYTTLLGIRLGDLETDASWVFALSGAGSLPLITICGEVITNVDSAISACGATADRFLTMTDIGINGELLVVTNGMLNELPQLMTVLIGTGAFLALYTTCDGLFLTMGLAISNDGYQYVVRPKSPKTVRLFMTRFFLIIVLIFCCWLTISVRPDPKLMFEFAAALTAAGLFPVLVSRFWGSTSESTTLLVASICGFSTTLVLLFLTNFGTDFTSGTGDEFLQHFPFTKVPLSNYVIGLLGTVTTTGMMYIPQAYNYILRLRQKEEIDDVLA